MREMIKTLVYGTFHLWKYDRKGFWDIYLGLGLFVLVFWFMFFVVLPIIGTD